MTEVVISLIESKGIPRNHELVHLGIPFARGLLKNEETLCLQEQFSSHETPVQFKPLAFWPDGSIRWLLTSFQCQLAAHQSKQYLVKNSIAEIPVPESSSIQIDSSQSGIFLKTENKIFHVKSACLQWEHLESDSGINEIVLTDENRLPCTAKIDSAWQVEENGSVYCILSSHGHWLRADNSVIAHFKCALKFCANSAIIEVTVKIHNQNRAEHRGGIWDLGDAGSIWFSSLYITTQLTENTQAKLLLNPSEKPVTFEENITEIYQNSSGGDNWNSRNHIDKHGKLTTDFCGYQVKSNDTIISTGKRADPILAITSGGKSIQFYQQYFWQNFPSTLEKNHQQIKVGLFPEQNGRHYELQGGESKSQTCYISYSAEKEDLFWARSPLIPTLSPDVYTASNSIPWFIKPDKNSALDDLLLEGIEGDNNFFIKREIIDEFGWRNFGDIFADHETHYQSENDPVFISHYNNQYDTIYGFARQFALTGDHRWFQLMEELAKHVIDIDTYKTEQDKAEYNNGLFWHTDHYLDAHTATHRTYSKYNSSSSTPGQTGGGPAAEHCYTTGLLYHFFLTGNNDSKTSVLKLAKWIRVYHEGSNGLFEQFLSLKRNDLPKIKLLLSGIHVSSHLYPFTRGTGNYLNALLDAYLLAPTEDWLAHAGYVIKNTIHPRDDIAKRDLLNAEVSWSYLILLTSICKYILIKNQNEDFDNDYQFALDSFCHYSRWMLKNERLYLSDPDQLEFPNNTWTAQDIRKSMLMFIASEYDPTLSEAYLDKANEWLDSITRSLKDSNESHYSRILAILLQNYGPHLVKIKSYHLGNANRRQIEYGKPDLTFFIACKRILSRLIKSIYSFRLSREIHWLKLRIKR